MPLTGRDWGRQQREVLQKEWGTNPLLTVQRHYPATFENLTPHRRLLMVCVPWLFCYHLYSWVRTNQLPWSVYDNISSWPHGDWQQVRPDSIAVPWITDYLFPIETTEIFLITSYSATVLKEGRRGSLCFVILEQVFHYVKSNYNSERNNAICETVK